MTSKAKYERNKSLLADLSTTDLKAIYKIEQEAIARYTGDMRTLASALGFLRLGYEVGWRVLLIAHHKATIKKYEDILGIEIRQFFDEEGPGAERSIGLKFAKSIGKFWEVVRGQEKHPQKGDLS
ncbi:MAG: hypothetical protein R3F50_02635 [Gammaproteobacteria bacterium]|jgi:hypothetical protein